LRNDPRVPQDSRTARAKNRAASFCADILGDLTNQVLPNDHVQNAGDSQNKQNQLSARKLVSRKPRVAEDRETPAKKCVMKLKLAQEDEDTVNSADGNPQSAGETSQSDYEPDCAAEEEESDSEEGEGPVGRELLHLGNQLEACSVSSAQREEDDDYSTLRAALMVHTRHEALSTLTLTREEWVEAEGEENEKAAAAKQQLQRLRAFWGQSQGRATQDVRATQLDAAKQQKLDQKAVRKAFLWWRKECTAQRQVAAKQERKEAEKVARQALGEELAVSKRSASQQAMAVRGERADAAREERRAIEEAQKVAKLEAKAEAKAQKAAAAEEQRRQREAQREAQKEEAKLARQRDAKWQRDKDQAAKEAQRAAKQSKDGKKSNRRDEEEAVDQDELARLIQGF